METATQPWMVLPYTGNWQIERYGWTQGMTPTRKQVNNFTEVTTLALGWGRGQTGHQLTQLPWKQEQAKVSSLWVELGQNIAANASRSVSGGRGGEINTRLL